MTDEADRGSLPRCGVTRCERAIRAAIAVAQRLGMGAIAPVVLKNSNHTNIHLAPFPIVARVVTPVVSRQVARNLADEVAVAQHLAHRGAPIAAPSVDVPAGPHSDGDTLMTLWQFVSHRPAGATDGVAAAEALQAVHRLLASYPRRLPAFTVAIDYCRSLLEDGTALPALGGADRAFLVAEHDRLRGRMRGTGRCVAIHGDAHLGNVLVTALGPRWVDWESVCMGPPEWDLSCLPERVWSGSRAVDHDLLTLLKDLRSVCVAVWCWVEPDRTPERREAAEFHLRRLRDRAHMA